MAAILTLPSGSPSPPAEPAVAPPPLSADVYRRRRLAVAAVVLGLVLGALSVGQQADASRTADARAADSVTHVVQPGDTLWSIATGLAPGADPRPLVDALDGIAGGPLLQPGQRITIPGELLD